MTSSISVPAWNGSCGSGARAAQYRTCLGRPSTRYLRVGSGRPSTTVCPVSSATSRTAAPSTCSAASSLPLGQLQSCRLGRWTRQNSGPAGPARQTRAPAARIRSDRTIRATRALPARTGSAPVVADVRPYRGKGETVRTSVLPLELVEEPEDESGRSGHASSSRQPPDGASGDHRVLVVAEQLGHVLQVFGEGTRRLSEDSRYGLSRVPGTLRSDPDGVPRLVRSLRVQPLDRARQLPPGIRYQAGQHA